MHRIAAATFAFGVIGCVAAAIIVGLDAPDSEFDSLAVDVSKTSDYQYLVDIALDDYNANNARTEGAPQQQVVNGWVARDLLQIVARQNEAQADTLDSLVALRVADPPDDRPARLLMIFIVLTGWIALWRTLPTMLSSTRMTTTEPPLRTASNVESVEASGGAVTDPAPGDPQVPLMTAPVRTFDPGTDTSPPATI